MQDVVKIVEEVAKPLAGFLAGGGIARRFQRLRDLATTQMDAARENATGLEQHAYDLHDLIERNNDMRPTAGPFTFELPSLTDAALTGHRHRDHALLNAYRDLQIEVARANWNVSLTDRGEWDGYAALDTLDRRAYRIGARALDLAAAYRRRVGMRRMPLAKAEHDLERYIRDRARYDAGRPSILRPISCVRFVRARRRLARAGYVRLNHRA
ncbi:MAG: hypothetical protein EPN57_18345 [Paraburkholderia sp.]|nr:MAG: hypothetical protein EPN57_18345 [Paraburkholderia sp.]